MRILACLLLVAAAARAQELLVLDARVVEYGSSCRGGSLVFQTWPGHVGEEALLLGPEEFSALMQSGNPESWTIDGMSMEYSNHRLAILQTPEEIVKLKALYARLAAICAARIGVTVQIVEISPEAWAKAGFGPGLLTTEAANQLDGLLKARTDAAFVRSLSASAPPGLDGFSRDSRSRDCLLDVSVDVANKVRFWSCDPEEMRSGARLSIHPTLTLAGDVAVVEMEFEDVVLDRVRKFPVAGTPGGAIEFPERSVWKFNATAALPPGGRVIVAASTYGASHKGWIRAAIARSSIRRERPAVPAFTEERTLETWNVTALCTLRRDGVNAPTLGRISREPMAIATGDGEEALIPADELIERIPNDLEESLENTGGVMSVVGGELVVISEPDLIPRVNAALLDLQEEALRAWTVELWDIRLNPEFAASRREGLFHGRLTSEEFDDLMADLRAGKGCSLVESSMALGRTGSRSWVAEGRTLCVIHEWDASVATEVAEQDPVPGIRDLGRVLLARCRLGAEGSVEIDVATQREEAEPLEDGAQDLKEIISRPGSCSGVWNREARAVVDAEIEGEGARVRIVRIRPIAKE